ncbi:MAG: hypothetical protein HZA50_16855 [Planctomycetes bacterium]|nr:hypothetical protein [Planctomycetota bacterium]
MIARAGFIAAVALSMNISFSFGQDASTKPSAVAKSDEKVLGALPDKRVNEVVSDDGCHYACQVNNKIMVDGVEGPACEQIINGPLMSRNGLMVAYIAKQAGKFFVIVNGKAFPGLDAVEYIAVNNEGTQASWMSTRNNDRYWAFFTNGREVKSLEKPRRYHDFALGSSGKFVYWADIWHSEETPPQEDGRGRGTWRQHLFVDGNDKGVFAEVAGKSISISPDGRQYSAAVTFDDQRKKWKLIVNDAHWAEYKEYGPVCYAPDGRRNAYVAKSLAANARPHLVVDLKEGPEYDQIDEKSFTFSPDGSRFACVVVKQEKNLLFLDGREYPLEQKPKSIHFSPDGRAMAMVVPKGDKQQIVIDGKGGKEYDEIALITFSPDGAKLAFAAKQGSNWMVVTDGKEMPAYANIHTLRYMPDLRRVAYLVSKGGGSQAIVVDDQEAGEYPMIASGAPKISANGTLEYLAIKDNKLIRVTSRPPAKAPAGSIKEVQPQTQPAK